MIERRVDLPTIGLIAGTRVAFGVGVGLLLGDRLTSERRQASGWALVAVGALTTIPLALRVLGASTVNGKGGKRNVSARHRFRRQAANGRKASIHEE
jgi:hypothetical protein